MLEPRSLPAIAFSPTTPTARERPAAAILHLCILALVAAATVAAFFGVGLVLLVHHPAAPTARETAPATTTRVSAAPLRPGEAPATGGRATSSAAAPTRQNADNASGQAPPMRPSEPSATANTPAPVPPAPADGSATRAAPGASTTAPKIPTPNIPTPDIPTPESATTGPAAAPPPASLRLPTARIAALLARGDALFRRGDFAPARRLYQHAFDMGAGRGALGIGATFDPNFLDRGRRHGLRGDPAMASFWYRRALALGAAEAEGRLAALAAQPPR